MTENVFFAQDRDGLLRRWYPGPQFPLQPTPEMIDAGAQRLVGFEGGAEWPRDFSPLLVAAARNEAERVWRSMYVAFQEQSE